MSAAEKCGSLWNRFYCLDRRPVLFYTPPLLLTPCWRRKSTRKIKVSKPCGRTRRQPLSALLLSQWRNHVSVRQSTAMKRFNGVKSKPEPYVLLFFLGTVLLSWPFLSAILDKDSEDVFGYFFFIWAVIILCLFLMRKNREQATPPEKEDGDDRDV